MKVFVTGNTKLTSADMKVFCKKLVDALHSQGHSFTDITEVVRGTSIGAEYLMHKVADHKNIPVRQILPSEDKYGKKARLVANWDIMPHVDLAIVFEDKNDEFVQKTKAVLEKCGKRFVVID